MEAAVATKIIEFITHQLDINKFQYFLISNCYYLLVLDENDNKMKKKMR